jgi:Phosphorylase superfamily
MDLNALVLVPQGAEFQAVKKGLGRSSNRFESNGFELVAIPIGIDPVTQFLSQFWAESDDRRSPIGHHDYSQVIVMGLCGSLSPDLAVGDAVVYQCCQSLNQSNWQCHPIAIPHTKLVKGFTSDRVICTATEKQELQRSTGCQVVDMEGTAILQFFAPWNIPVTILRVVSDDLAGDLPDLAGAIDAQGNLQPLSLARKMIQQPIAAMRLIRGSMRGLDRLRQLAIAVHLD